MTCPKQ